MTQPRVTPRVRRPAAALALLLLAALGAGCIREPEAQTCPTGIYCPSGAGCALRQAVCIFDGCGDGVLTAGEVCDDGNILDADGCSANCKSDESCGNLVTDESVGEVCDEGDTLPGDGCAADCKSFERCGDGKVDPGEDCDTTVESRSCNADCSFAVHGDGKINRAFSEICDGNGAGLGNGFDCQWAGCNANCTVSAHGDGWVNPLDGEACDGDGRGAPAPGPGCQSASCNENCTLSQHGDGWVNPRDGEACDGDGNGVPVGPECQSATCNLNCSVSRHGDGWVNPQDNEGCDGNGLGVGNGVDCQSLTCNADCTASLCGDAKPNEPYEECDDGNTSNLDDCKNDCRRNFCGDGLVKSTGTPPLEACDLGSALNGIESCAYGLVSCQLCSSTCATLPLEVHYCGDGTVDGALGGETCDDDRSFACATCSPTTCRIPEPRITRATGRIEVFDPAVADGDTFTVDDGVNPPVTFEFDTGGGLIQVANQRVNLQSVTTVDGVATAIRAAMTLVSATLTVQPLPSAAGPNPIVLENAIAGVNGNVPIEATGSSIAIEPASGRVVIQGLSGGAGCAPGAQCAANRDCVSNSCSNSRGRCN